MNRSPDFDYNRNISDLIRKANKRHIMPETGWNSVGPSETHGINFQNSWNNVGPSEVPASWYLNANGEVKMRGKISGGSVDTTIFVLPTEVRPEWDLTFIVPLEDDGSIHLENIEFRAFNTSSAFDG